MKDRFNLLHIKCLPLQFAFNYSDRSTTAMWPHLLDYKWIAYALDTLLRKSLFVICFHLGSTNLFLKQLSLNLKHNGAREPCVVRTSEPDALWQFGCSRGQWCNNSCPEAVILWGIFCHIVCGVWNTLHWSLSSPLDLGWVLVHDSLGSLDLFQRSVILMTGSSRKGILKRINVRPTPRQAQYTIEQQLRLINLSFSD